MNRFAAIAALALSGCATTAPNVSVEGPVTVILNGWRDTAKACAAISGQPNAIGCMTRRGNHVTILCPVDGSVTLAQCLAHEIRHVVEPQWHH